MHEPIVFISHFKVREGKLEGFEDLSRAAQSALEEEKPRTAAYLFYLNEDRSELTIVHLFPDADAMDVHFEGSDERAAAAYEFVEPAGWEIYGRPNTGALGMMREAAARSNVGLVFQPQSLGGFLRLKYDA
jgi:quinol monooxygenase YgiN